MPWRETSAMDERLRFVQDMHRPGWSIAELCRRYEVSRKTGYKWLRAYARGGPAALADGSHRPQTSPHATAPKVVRLILELQRHYKWGARKVRRLLSARVPADQVPTKTTIHRILERHGRVRPRRRSPRRMHPGAPGTPMEQPNAVWTADFKRQFRHYGLPERIRTDNGQPFASNALGRLSTLSVWWVRLGIRPELIEPAHPEQNGRHERMHKTLKAETARPPRRTLAAQQGRFDWFRHRYNAERPHEALGQRLPASLYQTSPRPYPPTLLPITYPGHYEVRRVSRNGGIRWGNRWVNVSHVLAELDVGFEEIDDGLWEVYFGPVWLGRLHETTCRIVDHLGRAARREGGNHKGKVLPIS